MDEVMQIAFELRENLQDVDYKRLVEKIAEVNPGKGVTVEYPEDIDGVNAVISASPEEHIKKLKFAMKRAVEKYHRDTKRYLKHIMELSEDNMKLRKDAEEWDDDEDD